MLGSVLRSAVVVLLIACFDARSADIGFNSGTRSAELSALGDRLFREARFDDAEAAYSQALDLDRRNVQAHLGIGKIASLLSEPRRAASHYAAAYQIAPRNPDTILAFAGIVDDSEARQTLFRNFLAFSKDARAEDVAAKLRVEQRVPPELRSALNCPYQSYRIPLSAIRDTGVAVRARINGGRELKLILDTGASGIVLNRSAGSEMKLEYLVDASLWGFGSGAPSTARLALASSFETGELKLANPLLNVSDAEVTREADGMIGLDVFRDFLIRLDLPARMLELSPFVKEPSEGGEETPVCAECLRAYRLGHLLLVRGTVNGHADGYFVLDSGSPYSLVSRKLLHDDGRPATFTGAQGGQTVVVRPGPVSIRLGDWHLMDFDCATFDAAEISSRNGTEIAGAIGFSLLRDMALTVDYRAGSLKFSKSIHQ